MTLIVDASVAIKWFVEEEATALATSLLERAEPLQAPDLLVVEVTNIAWKKALRGDIDVVHAQLIAAQTQGPFNGLFPTVELHERALELALELNHPVYDCVYLACAEQFDDGCVVTADQRLCNAIGESRHAGLVKSLAEMGN